MGRPNRKDLLPSVRESLGDMLTVASNKGTEERNVVERAAAGYSGVDGWRWRRSVVGSDPVEGLV
jgi:hypothetical protein